MKIGTSNLSTRIAWIEKTLKKIPRGNRILDAGAGEQRYKKYCSHLRYTSQDFDKYDGKGDKKGLQTGKRSNTETDIVSDITSIPVSNGSFDAVICTEVFEHLPEPLLALKEFSRIIKKGGYLIITAPFCSLTHYSPYHYYTGFNRYFYETHLAKFNFKIIEIKANGNFFEYLAQEIRRIPEIKRIYIKSNKWNAIEILVFKTVLLFLSRWSKRDIGSNELLNFGYHVYARKIK
jgi:ubiquinone/menaquinone biosynthesis C-methylase UbiE